MGTTIRRGDEAGDDRPLLCAGSFPPPPLLPATAPHTPVTPLLQAVFHTLIHCPVPLLPSCRALLHSLVSLWSPTLCTHCPAPVQGPSSLASFPRLSAVPTDTHHCLAPMPGPSLPAPLHRPTAVPTDHPRRPALVPSPSSPASLPRHIVVPTDTPYCPAPVPRHESKAVGGVCGYRSETREQSRRGGAQHESRAVVGVSGDRSETRH